MRRPTEAEIRRFFATITPDDFADPVAVRPRRRSRRRFVQEPQERNGPEEFERFIATNLDELVADAEPRVVLHDGSESRLFHAWKNESTSRFLARVRGQARRFEPKWIFVGVEGEASMGHPFDPTIPQDVLRARQAGHLMRVTNWYAESVEAGHEDMCFGIILREDDEPTVVKSTYHQGANPAFRQMLQHP
jgi:hypothetical protein